MLRTTFAFRLLKTAIRSKSHKPSQTAKARRLWFSPIDLAKNSAQNPLISNFRKIKTPKMICLSGSTNSPHIIRGLAK
jgi:hypothetical protein